MTVASVDPEQALAKCNALSANPIKPGDVVLSIQGTDTQSEMVEKLRQEIALTANVVRFSKFEAVIERESAGERAGMQVQIPQVTPAGGKLMITKIEDYTSPVTRYNANNYLKPLVKGDFIIAVDSKDTPDEMVEQIKANQTFTLSIERASATSL